MLDFAATFHVKKMRSGNPALYLLKEQFECFAVSPRKDDSCERIAHYLHQLEQFDEAGNWYEAAGRLAFERRDLRPELRVLFASKEYEKAMMCYRQCGNMEAEADCSIVLDGLKRACTPT